MSGISRKHISGYTTHNRVRFISSGAIYFALLKDIIDRAVHSIHLQAYIFEDDATGTMIGEALMRAASRGAAVYLMADGYASKKLSRHFIQQLKGAGVHFRFFEPFLRSPYFYVGRRMHHKVVVVDAKYALVGGMNIADRYNDLPGMPAWMDAAAYIEGEAAIPLFKDCCTFWGRGLANALQLPSDTNDFLKTFSEAHCSVRIRRNDWLHWKTQVWSSYLHLFNNASDSITIMCSYFLPGRRLRKALSRATARRVRVRVILAGQSDVWVAKWAERYLYQWMFHSGIEVYEYQPTVLHAKIAVADAHWVTVGSYNVNNISTYASIELNVDIRNRSFATEVTQKLEGIIEQDCVAVKPEKFEPDLTFLKRMMQRLSYYFVALVLWLFTFYFKHEKN